VGESWIKRPTEAVLHSNIQSTEQQYNTYMNTVALGWEGGYTYKAEPGKQGKWVKGAPSFQGGNLPGTEDRSTLTGNARGVDSQGRPMDVPPQQVIEPELPTTNPWGSQRTPYDFFGT
jgi:hypothetical protein